MLGSEAQQHLYFSFACTHTRQDSTDKDEVMCTIEMEDWKAKTGLTGCA